MIRNVLSIAGSDPSGGAGIQADLKTFAARGVYGMAVLTALTAQNTRGVWGIHAVPAAFVADQISAVLADIRVDAVKIGMIANAEIAEAVADALAGHERVPVVLDPVMAAKGGASLLKRDAVEVVVERLLPLARLLTPNLPEAALLLGMPEASDHDAMADQARRLLALGSTAVLVKGGHLAGGYSPDVLVSSGQEIWFEGKRTATPNTHGTGCTLSSGLCCNVLNTGTMARRAFDIFGEWNVQGSPVRQVSDPALCALVPGLQPEPA
jgi:hydroxymethylpyrimidine/phosphomethylpyrimidine kinase